MRASSLGSVNQNFTSTIVRCTAPHHTVCWFRQQQHLLPTSTEAHPRMICIANKHGLEGLKAKGGTGIVYRLDSSSTFFFVSMLSTYSTTTAVSISTSSLQGNFLDHGTTTTGTHAYHLQISFSASTSQPEMLQYFQLRTMHCFVVTAYVLVHSGPSLGASKNTQHK